MTRTRRTFSLVAVFVLALAAFAPAGAFAQGHGGESETTSNAIDDDGKIWVCKYTQTPGGDEVLKPGNDGLVKVDPNTLQNVDGVDHESPQVGDEWTDQHTLSRVIAPGDTCPPGDVEEDDELALVFAKAWTGDTADTLGDDNVSFTVDGTTVVPGATHPVELGDTLTLTEDVTGLDEGCTYESDLPATWQVPATDETAVDGVFTITVTNDVTCPADEIDEFFVAFTKDWTGDTADTLGDDNVSFTVDGTTVVPGATHPVELGDTLTLTEDVTGLDEGCTYESDLPATWQVPATDETAVDGVFTITVTNDVDCDDVTVDDEFAIVFTKDWAGDTDGFTPDNDGVVFTVNGTDLTIGQTFEVEPGQELTLSESYTGDLGDCTFSTDLPATWTVPDADQAVDGVFTILVTNTIDCDDVTVGEGALTIAKTALGVGDGNTVVIDEIGGSVDVDYEFVVTNTGGIDLTVATLDDTVLGDLLEDFMDAHGSTTLAPQDVVTFVVTATLTEADFEDGEHTNVVTVTTVEGPDAEADETITLVVVGDDADEAAIQLDKAAIGLEGGTAVIPLGGSVAVDYEFVVTNTGDVALVVTELVDSQIGDLLPYFVAQHGTTTLTPEDGPITFVATATLTEADVDADGTHTNLVRVETAQGVSDETSETIDVVVVGDQPPAQQPDEVELEPDVDRDDRIDDRVVVVAQPDDGAEVLGVTYGAADQLPRTGDSLLGMALGALLALGLGGLLLKLQPATSGTRSDEPGIR